MITLNILAIARGDGLYKKVISHYKKVQLLIFDEWLLTPLNENEARDLLEIIEARHGESSTVFISQFSPAGWHQKGSMTFCIRKEVRRSTQITSG